MACTQMCYRDIAVSRDDPELNAPVTVVWPGVEVVHARLYGPLLSGATGIRVQVDWQRSAIDVFGAEDVTWIRGYHNKESEPVLACRAAQALLLR